MTAADRSTRPASARRVGARLTRPVGALLPAVAIAISACGVPAGDETFVQIADADVPFGLADPSTTTTSTTSTTLPPPPTTGPEVAASSTTTLPPPAQEQVSLYFLSRGDLIAVPKEIRQGFSRNELIDELEAGPDDTGSPQSDTLITPGLIGQVDVQDGVATVDLDTAAYNRIRERDRLDAIAQIVLTLTDNRTRVGQVLFTFDGEEDLVPTPNSFFKRLVSFDDFAPLIADAVVVQEPDPTTTVPETTVPVDDPTARTTPTTEPAAQPDTGTTTTAPTVTTVP